ncbi:hypothetical protein DFH09DRAFT_912663, partial [Mycena vulgaris]
YASMVAMLNNERVAMGKPGLGFLNPLLYANPGAFNDMKSGKSATCFYWTSFHFSSRQQSGLWWLCNRLQLNVWLGSCMDEISPWSCVS